MNGFGPLPRGPPTATQLCRSDGVGPTLMGVPANMALFKSELGTIPYVLVTGLPMFLGSSLAYIAAISQ